MNIDIEALIKKRESCISALDCTKTCETCKFANLQAAEEPCASCYIEILGMPVNPTGWKP